MKPDTLQKFKDGLRRRREYNTFKEEQKHSSRKRTVKLAIEDVAPPLDAAVEKEIDEGEGLSN